MPSQVTLTFAGDADKLIKEAKRAEAATKGVADASTAASKDMANAGQSSAQLGDKMSNLGNATSGATDAISNAGGSLQAFVDLQDYARARAQRLARAALDVAQAQEDYNQALRDGKQASIDTVQAGVDLEQAQLDIAKAQKDYNDAVKENGKNSIEARQAQIDLKQAGVDVTQAQEDAAQATRDSSQANIDAKGAQLDLNDAMREAHPPELGKWAEQLNLLAPLLSGVVGVVALVTAAQWAWNAAQLASPTTWIIAGVVALIAVIVLIATKTNWFQRAWRNSWNWIKDAAQNSWNFIKKIPGWIGSAFSSIGRSISAPFRAAFNSIARMWNNTVGRISFSVPGWVPGIGGNGFSVPNIPTFHSGGKVPGVVGTATMALLQAGETVNSVAGSTGDSGGWVAIRGDAVMNDLIKAIANTVGAKGGRAAQLGIKFA